MLLNYCEVGEILVKFPFLQVYGQLPINLQKNKINIIQCLSSWLNKAFNMTLFNLQIS